jgi:hypothetical protein
LATINGIAAGVFVLPDFALAAPLQILLLQNARGGEMLGAAGGQIAFNLGSDRRILRRDDDYLGLWLECDCAPGGVTLLPP